MTKKVMLVLSHGYHVRNLVHSGFAAEIVRLSDLSIVTPFATSSHARGENDQVLSVGEDSCGNTALVPYKVARVDSFMQSCAKLIFAGRARSKALNVLTLQERERSPVKFFVSDLLNSTIGQVRFLRRLFGFIEQLLTQSREMNSAIMELAPSVVVLANYGTEPWEKKIISASRRNGIPTVSIVPSWDNLTSKGVVSVRPDFIIVWNEIMRREAIEIADFAPQQVLVSPPPQFDLYFADVEAARTKAVSVRRSKGRSLITYATVTPKYFPQNIYICQMIVDFIRQSLSPDLKLVIRLHPQVLFDRNYSDDLAAYHDFAAKNAKWVELNLPSVSEFFGLECPRESDQLSLRELLLKTLVAVGPASTFAIDALCCGAPFIGVGFDESGEESVHASYFKFSHYKALSESGDIVVCTSLREFNNELRNVVTHGEGMQLQFTHFENLLPDRSAGGFKRAVNFIEMLASDGNGAV